MRIKFCARSVTKQFPGHVPQLGETLQSLEHQLNLPTRTVRSQNARRRTAGAGRKHDHILSKFECSRPSDHCFLLALYYRGTKFVSDGKEHVVVAGAFCSDNPEQSWSVFYPITSKKSA